MTERWEFTALFCSVWIVIEVIQTLFFDQIDFSGSIACIVIVSTCAIMMPNKKEKGATQ